MKWFGSPAPFPSTLQWLYAASLSYALAIALYQIFCPPEIKRFGNPDEYIATQHEIFLRAHPQHRESIVLANLDKQIDRRTVEAIEDLHHRIDCASREEKQTLQNQLDQLVLSLHPDAVQRFLIRDYRVKDLSKVAARWVSFILYLNGTLTLLSLLLIRSYNVLIK